MKKETGFIKLIIVLVAALVILGYFGFNVEQILKSPSVSGNLEFAWGIVAAFWQKFLAGPAVFIWNKIIIGLI